MPIIVPAFGPLDARLGIVGEAPGRNEEEHLPEPEPFVGMSGEVLASALGGWEQRARARITNVRKIRPPQKEAKKQKYESIRAWRESLEEDLAGMSEVRTLLLVGGDALEAVLGVRHISLYHGSVLSRTEAEALRAVETEFPPVAALPPKVHTIVGTYHPAFALRGKPMFKPMIKTVIARAARWSQGEDGPARVPSGFFNLEASAGEVGEFLAREDAARQPIALDVETPFDNAKQIDICGVATSVGAVVFPWSVEHREVIREFMQRPGVVAGHNFGFDLRALAAYGIEPARERRVVDTIVAGALLWPPSRTTKKTRWLALSTCVSRVLDGVPFWKGIPRNGQPPENKWRDALYRATWPLVPEWLHGRLYCGLDCVETSRLWGAQRALLHREAML